MYTERFFGNVVDSHTRFFLLYKVMYSHNNNKISSLLMRILYTSFHILSTHSLRLMSNLSIKMSM
jgi:hypothetical protein